MYREFKTTHPGSVFTVAPSPSSSTVVCALNRKEDPGSSAVCAVNGKQDKDDANTSAQTKRQNSQTKDVMISYSHADDTAMLRLRDTLENNGIHVWVDVTGLKAGVDFLSKIGQAIIDSRCFIILLSESSINSKYCQDELALAYVSNKCIFPCGLEPQEKLFPLMGTGMKLTLSSLRWSMIGNPATYDSNIAALVATMKTSIQEQMKQEERKQLIRRKSSLHRLNKRAQRSTFSAKMESANENMSLERMMTFWERNFEESTEVDWDEFYAAFDKDYAEPQEMMYQEEDRLWLRDILARELNVEKYNGRVLKDEYVAFCTVDDEFQPFWLRVQDQAAESYTMREVFEMESSVRVKAIENLGKYRSTGVIEALMDLLTDSDNNVRAVAAISLARTGANTAEVVKMLMKALDDKDRLVRESGCLALGHLKAEAAVQKIVHLWRNDFISHVREAAQVALEQIGGEEANKAMHMTKVLSDEIRMLTNE